MARIATYQPPIVDCDPPGPPAPPDYRALVVAYVESQLGVTDPTPYWMAVHGSVPIPAPGKRIHWCGAFALMAIREAGLCDWQWSFAVRHPGFIWRIGWGAATAEPQPGDVCYLERAQHHAIVERVDATRIETIDGNTGRAPGIVSRKSRLRTRRGVHYYSITALIGEAVSRMAGHDTDPCGPPESRP